MKRFLNKIKQNIKGFKFNRHEIAGSLGDMGLYLPLVTAMITINQLSLTSVLFFSGFFNLLSGFIFGIPICVQPMKAIATVAIAEGLTAHQILAAGIITAVVILFLGLSNLIKYFNKIIPQSVVRGIQVALGLKLLSKGIEMIMGTKIWFGYDSIVMGIICALLILLLFSNKRAPAALIIFSLGILLTIFRDPQILQQLSFSISLPKLVSFTRADFITGGLLGAIPQIPLTTLNSVIAVCALSGKLFPKKRLDEKEMAVSIGLMNIVGCFFGGMPSCHGSGGLAGQYRYGARTGGSMVFLGSVKMILAIFLGASLIPFFVAYPQSVLGALLFFSGMELALFIKDVERKRDLFILFMTVAGILVLNIAVGFLIGFICAYLISWGWVNIDGHKK